MSFVYILQDSVSNRYYTGSCVDLETRVSRHTKHTDGNTTKIGEWKLVYFCRCESIEEARKLEKLVKSYKGGNAFKKIINGDVAEWSKVPHC